MIGQLNLLSRVNNLIENNQLPRTLLLEGEFGCGKHTLASYIADKLGYELIDITDRISLETLEQITLSPIPNVYSVNITKSSIKEQNMLLKFLEEPLKNSYILLLCENKQKLIETVVNRCQCFKFEGYTKDELEQFTGGNNLLLEYAATPGMILKLKDVPLNSMIELSCKIFQQINKANYSNVLTIPDKFWFGKEPDNDKLEFDIFAYIMQIQCYKMYCSYQIPFCVYTKTCEFTNNLSIFNINKKNLFENFLVSLKMVLGG